MSFQDTFLQDTNQLIIKNYQQYSYLNKDGNRASGKVSILIRKDIPQHQISIDTELQVTPVKATLHKPINICFIYILPHNSINGTKPNKLIEQIRKPHLSNLKSHNTIWGCQENNKKSRLCHLNPCKDSYSAIDMTLCDLSSYMVYSDLCDCDYFSIILKSPQSHHD